MASESKLWAWSARGPTGAGRGRAGVLVPQGASGGRESEHPDRPRSPRQGPGSGRGHRGRLGTAGPWLPEALHEGRGRRRPASPSRSFPGLARGGPDVGAPSAASSCVLTGHHTGEEPCSWPGGPGPVTLTGSFVIYATTEQRGEPRVPGSTAREAAAASGTDRVSSACGRLGVRGQNRRAGASSPNCPGPQCHGSGHGGTDGRGQRPGGPGRGPRLPDRAAPPPALAARRSWAAASPGARGPGRAGTAGLALAPRASGGTRHAGGALPRAAPRGRQRVRQQTRSHGGGGHVPPARDTHARAPARRRAEQRPNERVTHRCPHSLHGRENREHVTSAVTATHTHATAGSAQAALSWPPSGLLLEGFTQGPQRPRGPSPDPGP